MKCEHCIYRGIYRDMGASVPYCILYTDFIEAIRAYDCVAECEFKKTINDVRKELGINERKEK